MGRQLSLVFAILCTACDGNMRIDGGIDGSSTLACADAAEGASCGEGRICRRTFGCIVTRCGDMFLDEAAGEQCDDGNQMDSDGCNTDCRLTCLEQSDCDDGDPCNGVEVCTAAFICDYGVTPVDHPACTLNGGGSGICRTGECRPRCDPTAPFTDVQELTQLNTTSTEGAMRLSSDERTAYFASDRPDGQGGFDIYMTTRSSPDGSFGPASPVPGVNTSGHELNPSISGDGLFLYADDFDPNVVVAERSSVSVDFGAFAPVLGMVNDASVTDVQPYILPDNSALYFISRRTGDLRIHRAARTDGSFPVVITPASVDLNTTAQQVPAITPDERVMYFAGGRDGTTTLNDIYVVTQSAPGAGFGASVRVDELSTDTHDYPNWISADACTIYFQRFGATVGDSGDMYVARRTPAL